MGQRRDSPDAERINLIGQRQGLKSSVWKLLQLSYLGGVYWKGKTAIETAMTLIQTIYPNRFEFHVGKQGVCLVEVGALATVFKKISNRTQNKYSLIQMDSYIWMCQCCYIHQLCMATGYCLENFPGVMSKRGRMAWEIQNTPCSKQDLKIIMIMFCGWDSNSFHTR